MELLITKLALLAIEGKYNILNSVEAFVVLVVGVNEVLDFSESEFSIWLFQSKINKPDSQQTRSGGDFVTVSRTDLSSSKRQFATSSSKEPTKIYKHALSGLWTEVTRSHQKKYSDRQYPLLLPVAPI